MSPLTASNPWYRHRWPWILIAGPAIVVVASMITLWLAVSSNDGLVSDDYYRQGLTAGQTLHRSKRAVALGLSAHVQLKSNRLVVRLAAMDPGFVAPARLRVTLSHPTRAGLDQAQLMERSGGVYEAGYRLPASGHWLVTVEDEGADWRLLGKLVLPAQGESVIGQTEQDVRQKAADHRD